MANIIKGNTVSGFTTQPLQTESNLSLIVVNKTGGTITLNLQIISGNTTTSICPLNLQLASGTSYEDDNVIMQSQEELVISVNGSCDYYFNFEATSV